MKKIKYILIFIICLILHNFTYPGIVSGVNKYFVDEFNTLDSNKWKYVVNGGSVIIEDGVLKLNSSGINFPVVYSKLETLFLPDKDSTFEIRFRYDSNGTMGDGIGLGFTGSASNYPFYQFALWRDTGSQIIYNDFNTPDLSYCNPTTDGIDLTTRKYANLNIDNSWHILKIERVDTAYKIYFDQHINPDPVVETESDQCLPKNIIIGNPLSGGSYTWNSMFVDYVKLYSISDLEPTVTVNPTPTLIPTNTPPQGIKKKIIILPGLGASWNTKAMVYNDTNPDLTWKMTPYVNNYNKLIETFEDNDLVEGDDFYVWNYDWRKPVGDIVDKLSEYIEDKIKEDEKVSLVGHSLGGLTARLWAQSHYNDSRLDQVISLGGPQQGAVDAYEVWNGAKINKSDISGIALNVLLALQKNKKPTKLETIRNYAPVLKDILPVFNFTRQCNSQMSFTDLKTVNNYLLLANTGYTGVSNKLSFVIGDGEKTKEWINLSKVNKLSKKSGIWPDGKPIGYIWGNGDNTVLKKSAYLEESFVKVSSNHADIVDNSVSTVVAKLGLTTIHGGEGSNDLSDKLVYFIGSPAYLKVICDGNEMGQSDVDGFLMLDSNGVKRCVLTVVGTDSGTYHLVTGKASDQYSWRYFENEIMAGQTDTIVFNGTSGLPFVGQNNKYFCELIERSAKSLAGLYPKDQRLLGLIDGSEKCNISKIIEKTFSFRWSKHEVIVTNQIIDYIKELLMARYEVQKSKTFQNLWERVRNDYENFERFKEKGEKNSDSLSVFEIYNYQKLSDMFDEGSDALNAKRYDLLMANAELIKHMLMYLR